jgi:hypothetical protein
MKKDGVSCQGHTGLRASLDEGSRMACGGVPEQLLRDPAASSDSELIPARAEASEVPRISPSVPPEPGPNTKVH